MTPKQDLYRRLLRHSIIFMRSGLSNAACRKFWPFTRVRPLIPRHIVAEFVHDIPMRMQFPDFSESDIHFLNSHAHYFYEKGYVRGNNVYFELNQLVAELFALVPDEMRDQLDWAGPDEDEMREMISKENKRRP